MRSGNLDLPEVLYGYEYTLTAISLMFMVTTIFIAAFTERFVLNLFFGLFNLGLVYLVRSSIHFQGFLDHDYNSKTGLGFHLFFTFSIIQFMLIMIYMIKALWEIRKAAPNTRLAKKP